MPAILELKIRSQFDNLRNCLCGFAGEGDPLMDFKGSERKLVIGANRAIDRADTLALPADPTCKHSADAFRSNQKMRDKRDATSLHHTISPHRKSHFGARQLDDQWRRFRKCENDAA